MTDVTLPPEFEVLAAAGARIRKLQQEKNMLAAVLVAAAGGQIVVRNEILEDARSFVVTQTYDHAKDETTYTVKGCK